MDYIKRIYRESISWISATLNESQLQKLTESSIDSLIWFLEEYCYLVEIKDFLSLQHVQTILLFVGILINLLLIVKYYKLHSLQLAQQNRQIPQSEPPPPPPSRRIRSTQLLRSNWQDIPGNENVLRLDDSWKLSLFLSANSDVLVLFYVPWCEYCNEFIPIFARTAGILATMEDHVRKSYGSLVAVNCDANPLISQVHEVKSFPTTKYYRNGSFASEYFETRSVKTLLHFLKQVTQRQ